MSSLITQPNGAFAPSQLLVWPPINSELSDHIRILDDIQPLSKNYSSYSLDEKSNFERLLEKLIGMKDLLPYDRLLDIGGIINEIHFSVLRPEVVKNFFLSLCELYSERKNQIPFDILASFAKVISESSLSRDEKSEYLTIVCDEICSRKGQLSSNPEALEVRFKGTPDLLLAAYGDFPELQSRLTETVRLAEELSRSTMLTAEEMLSLVQEDKC